MEIRDPIHGNILLDRYYIPVVQHPFFQRLRKIKQVGMTELVFPGATHTRFIHSLGVFALSQKAFQSVFPQNLNSQDYLKLKHTLQLAALLHDIGHAPLSHASEFAMPGLGPLGLPPEYMDDPTRQANHEDYTLKIILDSSLTASLKPFTDDFGVEIAAIADLIRGTTPRTKYFTVNSVNFFPLLCQLVSSELDCDRMDYLLRDSYFCGVSYGKYDLDWLLQNMKSAVLDNSAYLAISIRSVPSFDDFLLGRYHMFLLVYFHYKSVCLEKLLERFFHTSDEYKISHDIESYKNEEDYGLLTVLQKSSNKYAKCIYSNNTPPKIYESFTPKDRETLSKLNTHLTERGVETLMSSSKGRISKYYGMEKSHESFPLLVLSAADKYLTEGTSQILGPIENITDIYKQFNQTYQVDRLHCFEQDLTPKLRKDLQLIVKKG